MQRLFHIPVRRYIQQHLRGHRHPAGQHAQRLAGLLHGAHQLDRRQLPVPGGHIFPENDVSRLLPADVVAVFPHILQHIAVAHLGGLGMDALLPGKPEKAEAAHHRHHGGVAGQASLRLHLPGKDGDHLVAVDHPALLIHRQAAVGVAVKGHRQVVFSLLHQAGKVLHMGGAAFAVDIGAVGRVAEEGRFGPQQPEQCPGGAHGAAVGAVHQHLHPRQSLRHGGGQVFGVADSRQSIFGTAADLLRLRRDQRDIPVQQHPLDLVLLVVGQLVALRPEDLDAVEFIGVMGSGDHHPRRRLFLHRQVGHRRGGDNPQQHHVGAAGHQPGRHGGLQHIAGKTGILADYDRRPLLGVLLPDYLGQRTADLGGALGGKVTVGDAPHAVGSK